KFYQFWLNASDEDLKGWIRIFTLLEEADILALEAEHEQAPHLRVLQKALAADVTTRVHGAQALEVALNTSSFLFGGGSLEFLHTIRDAKFQEIFEVIPQFSISKQTFKASTEVVSLLADAPSFFAFKGEEKKMIQAGGVWEKRERVEKTKNKWGGVALFLE